MCFVRAREDDGDRAHHVRPLERLLRRPDREEAAQPLPARAARCCRSAPPGCNLACRFCQNWDISKSKEIDTLADAASPDTIAPDGAASSGCRSVAFTYNDPMIFLEYAIDVADACRAVGHRERWR